jgi:hypothetical protein
MMHPRVLAWLMAGEHFVVRLDIDAPSELWEASARAIGVAYDNIPEPVRRAVAERAKTLRDESPAPLTSTWFD